MAIVDITLSYSGTSVTLIGGSGDALKTRRRSRIGQTDIPSQTGDALLKAGTKLFEFDLSMRVYDEEGDPDDQVDTLVGWQTNEYTLVLTTPFASPLATINVAIAELEFDVRFGNPQSIWVRLKLVQVP